MRARLRNRQNEKVEEEAYKSTFAASNHLDSVAVILGELQKGFKVLKLKAFLF